MGIVYINSSSNTMYQVVRIILENNGTGEGVGQRGGVTIFYHWSENASLMR